MNDTLCEVSQRPALEQICAAPCPVDCVLSQWSSWLECDEECGEGSSSKIRFRRVLRVALYGGEPCPDEADSDGKFYTFTVDLVFRYM